MMSAEPIRDGQQQDVLTLTFSASAAVPPQQTPPSLSPGVVPPPRPTRAMQ